MKTPTTNHDLKKVRDALIALKKFAVNDLDRNFCVEAIEAYNRLEAQLVPF
jgi:hypothetical protein